MRGWMGVGSLQVYWRLACIHRWRREGGCSQVNTGGRGRGEGEGEGEGGGLQVQSRQHLSRDAAKVTTVPHQQEGLTG